MNIQTWKWWITRSNRRFPGLEVSPNPTNNTNKINPLVLKLLNLEPKQNLIVGLEFYLFVEIKYFRIHRAAKIKRGTLSAYLFL